MTDRAFFALFSPLFSRVFRAFFSCRQAEKKRKNPPTPALSQRGQKAVGANQVCLPLPYPSPLVDQNPGLPGLTHVYPRLPTLTHAYPGLPGLTGCPPPLPPRQTHAHVHLHMRAPTHARARAKAQARIYLHADAYAHKCAHMHMHTHMFHHVAGVVWQKSVSPCLWGMLGKSLFHRVAGAGVFGKSLFHPAAGAGLLGKGLFHPAAGVGFFGESLFHGVCLAKREKERHRRTKTNKMYVISYLFHFLVWARCARALRARAPERAQSQKEEPRERKRKKERKRATR